ncbi:unnamed protein product, partial [Discosporangium mesarthrocarpum]
MDADILARIARFVPHRPHIEERDELSSRSQAAPPTAAGVHVNPPPHPTRVSPLVHMVCFSKDRAFQLDQLLQSVSRHLTTDGVLLKISVLYAIEAGERIDRKEGLDSRRDEETDHGWSMSDSYNAVASLHRGVNFVREESGSFYSQLREIIKDPGGQGVDRSAFVLFAVDDMFFYDHCPLLKATVLLDTDQSVSCVHLRLNPSITWSHTTGTPCKVPPLTPSKLCPDPSRKGALRVLGELGSGTETGIAPKVGMWGREEGVLPMADFDILTFVRSEGSGEWDYPWDLTGGLYRLPYAEAVLDSIVNTFGEAAAANPNLLEHNGHRLLLLPPAVTPPSDGPMATPSATPVAAAVACSTQPLRQMNLALAPRGACAGRSVLCSIAVNRVQTTYSTPVYQALGGGVRDLDLRLREYCRKGGSAGQDGGGGSSSGISSSGISSSSSSSRAAGRFDASFYRLRRSNSVHVGDLAFRTVPGEGGEEGGVEGGGGGGSNRKQVALSYAGVRYARGSGCENQERPGLAVAVTVLLPVLNGGAHLLEAVQSILDSRPFPDLELLVIDDGSDDGAVEAALGAAVWGGSGLGLQGEQQGGEEGRGRDGRLWVRVIRHEAPLGLAVSLNEGLREARGELVARMDADDVCLPDRLRCQVEFMTANPQVVVAGTSVAIFGDSGDSYCRVNNAGPSWKGGIPLPRFQRIVRHPTDRGFLGWSLLFSCCLAHPSVILRRDEVLRAGGYDPGAEPAEDYDLWLRLESERPGMQIAVLRDVDAAAGVGDLAAAAVLLGELEAAVISLWGWG